MAATNVEILIDQHNRVLDYTEVGEVRNLRHYLEIHPGSRIVTATMRPSGMQSGYGYNPDTGAMIARDESNLHLPHETIHTRWDLLVGWGQLQQQKVAKMKAFQTGRTSINLTILFYGFIYNTLLIFHNPENRLDNECWKSCTFPDFNEFCLKIDYDILPSLLEDVGAGRFFNPNRVYLWKDNTIVLARPSDSVIPEGTPVASNGYSHYAVKKILGELQDQGIRKATLRNIELKNSNDDKAVTLVPEFDENIFEYTATVANEVNSVDVLASKSFAYAQAVYPSTVELQERENEPITLEVISHDEKSRQVYNITIIREENLQVLSDATLSSLVIKKQDGTVIPFDETFEPTRGAYNLRIPAGTTALTIEAIATHERAEITLPSTTVPSTFEIRTIRVTSANGRVTKNYEMLFISVSE